MVVLATHLSGPGCLPLYWIWIRIIAECVVGSWLSFHVGLPDSLGTYKWCITLCPLSFLQGSEGSGRSWTEASSSSWLSRMWFNVSTQHGSLKHPPCLMLSLETSASACKIPWDSIARWIQARPLEPGLLGLDLNCAICHLGQAIWFLWTTVSLPVKER